MLVVGTPGRLAELSREGTLQTHGTPALVLDEVDQLLAPHFREDLSRLLEHTGAPVVSLGFCSFRARVACHPFRLHRLRRRCCGVPLPNPRGCSSSSERWLENLCYEHESLVALAPGAQCGETIYQSDLDS